MHSHFQCSTSHSLATKEISSTILAKSNIAACLARKLWAYILRPSEGDLAAIDTVFPVMILNEFLWIISE